MAAKTYIIGGREMEMHTSGDLAEAVGREWQSIIQWEKKGVIPPTPFRARTGRRLYTKEMIDAIAKTALKYDLRQGVRIPDEFIEEVKRKFEEATPKI